MWKLSSVSPGQSHCLPNIYIRSRILDLFVAQTPFRRLLYLTTYSFSSTACVWMLDQRNPISHYARVRASNTECFAFALCFTYLFIRILCVHARLCQLVSLQLCICIYIYIDKVRRFVVLSCRVLSWLNLLQLSSLFNALQKYFFEQSLVSPLSAFQDQWFVLPQHHLPFIT